MGIFGYKYGYLMIDIEKIFISPEMVNLIAEIDEFRGAWQQMHQLAPDRLSALKKIASIESIGSSTRIEGAKLSDKKIALLLSHIDTASFQTRDEQEVAGYAFACEKILEHFKEIPIAENAIKEMHVWLLKYSKKDERHRGEYKKIPIRIEAFDSDGNSLGILFQTTSPLETPIKMHELILWTKQSLNKKALHPLIVIGLFVVVFLAIHPFQDGNGRLSRLLTTLLMLKSGYSYVPYSSMESVIEANKESYYLALQKTQKSWQSKKPNWTPWLLFFLTCLQRQKHHLEVKISDEKKIMRELPELCVRVLELLAFHGRLGISEIEILTKANRNTLKKTLALLVKDKRIQMNGKGKGSWYTI